MADEAPLGPRPRSSATVREAAPGASGTTAAPVAEPRPTSPDQLDRRMRVAGPMGWLIVATFVLVIVVAIVWGFVGSIPTHVAGQGILRLDNGGVRQVVARGDAQVAAIEVEIGESVKAGQVLARLHDPETDRKVADAQKALDTLRGDRDRLAAYYKTFSDEENRYLAEIRENTETMIAGGDRQIEANEKIVRALENLLRQHYTTSVEVEQARERLFSIRAAKDQNRQKLLDLAIQQLEQIQQRRQQLETYDLQIVEAEGKLSEAKLAQVESEAVESPLDGQVAELLVELDALVTAGTPLALLQFGDPTLSGKLYLPAGKAKAIREGMAANVSPDTVEREQYGTLVATVSHVALYPATEADMKRVLNDPNLVQTFLSSGPQLAVDVDLHPDAATPSGYRWSSGKGPTIELTSGTLATATVTIRQEPPIALVLPAIRRFLGIEP
jgi:HlyD family secretion protein